MLTTFQVLVLLAIAYLLLLIYIKNSSNQYFDYLFVGVAAFETFILALAYLVSKGAEINPLDILGNIYPPMLTLTLVIGIMTVVWKKIALLRQLLFILATVTFLVPPTALIILTLH